MTTILVEPPDVLSKDFGRLMRAAVTQTGDKRPGNGKGFLRQNLQRLKQSEGG